MENGPSNHPKNMDQTSYEAGWRQGYLDTIRSLLIQGYGQSATVRKSIMRGYVTRIIERKEVQKKILDWVFGKRSSISIRVLDHHVYLYEIHEMVEYQDEEQMARIIAEMARKKVIAGETRKNPWIG